jgi:hypothetical protein
MTQEEAVKTILEKSDGKIVPSFNATACDGYFIAFKASLTKKLYEMAEAGQLVKDFIHWTPKKFTGPDENNKIKFVLNGRTVERMLRKDGTVGESVFYLPAAVPEWINRRNTQRKEAQALAAELSGDTEVQSPPEDKAL